MTIKEWIAILAGRGAAPFNLDALEAQTVLPMEYFRNDDDTKSWHAEVGYQESRIAEGSRLANAARAEGKVQEYKDILARYFPQHRRSCDWPYACTFQEVCFGGSGDAYLIDPKSSGLYADRQPHHAPEVERILELTKEKES